MGGASGAGVPPRGGASGALGTVVSRLAPARKMPSKALLESVRTTRKLKSLSSESSARPLRFAARTRLAPLSHEPPRITRLSQAPPLRARPSLGAPL